ncbi:MAG: hypothetical protein Kow0080_18860 [Candidatus Promineifilaceae bacterium]
MPNYIQVPYNPDSPLGIVQSCLRYKKMAATGGSPGKIRGIAHQSCFSAVSMLIAGKPQLIYGNSRNKVPYTETGVACVHGECNAIWEAMSDADPNMPVILEMYVEIHPCPNCAAFLNNALPADQEVYYSFKYPDELAEWQIAARKLCHL